MTLAEALSHAQAAGVARLDAQLLLLHVLGRSHDRAWLLGHDDAIVSAQALARFQALCHRRAGGEPVAYLVGRKEFFGLDLQVDARVLVPRPETETLVTWALDLLADVTRPRVVDLGTGSGAIALALKQARPDAIIEAVDRNPGAVEVARANARALGLDVACRTGSWLADAVGSYDLVVSNPPYIAAADPHLAALHHEPISALAAGADGLDDLRDIVRQAPAHLRPGGWLLLEHGWDQAAAVQALLANAGFAEVQGRQDLAGIARCAGARRPELG